MSTPTGRCAVRLPTAHDVADAAMRLEGLVRRTPLVPATGFPGWLKLESMQHTGAYKVRGALNALLCQGAGGDRRPVVAASAGNHAAGVAYGARVAGIEAITVVPCSAPLTKIQRTRSLGARVICHGARFEDAYAEARRLARVEGWRFLHAFDDPDIIAGQGTIAPASSWPTSLTWSWSPWAAVGWRPAWAWPWRRGACAWSGCKSTGSTPCRGP